MFSQLGQPVPQSETKIDGEPPGVAVLIQVRKCLEGLLKVGHRLAERGPVVGPGPGLPAVGDGLIPDLPPQSMVRQALDLLGYSVPGERLKGLDDAGV